MGDNVIIARYIKYSSILIVTNFILNHAKKKSLLRLFDFHTISKPFSKAINCFRHYDLHTIYYLLAK